MPSPQLCMRQSRFPGHTAQQSRFQYRRACSSCFCYPAKCSRLMMSALSHNYEDQGTSACWCRMKEGSNKNKREAIPMIFCKIQIISYSVLDLSSFIRTTKASKPCDIRRCFINMRLTLQFLSGELVHGSILMKTIYRSRAWNVIPKTYDAPKNSHLSSNDIREHGVRIVLCITTF
jgi:hypothetical protein